LFQNLSIILTFAPALGYTSVEVNAEECMERIRQLRNEKGLSQAKLAVRADMDPATLNRLEQGKGNPNLKTLERVAEALGVEVADFFPVVGKPFFKEPGEGEEPDIVTLRGYVWREIEKDDALLQEVAKLVEQRDKAKAG
jgi:transcriptional regulator with XRE-family HTH domain